MRDDPAVARLLRDCDAAVSAASTPGPNGLPGVLAARSLLEQALESAQRLAQQRIERETLETVVVPSIAALRRRLDAASSSGSRGSTLGLQLTSDGGRAYALVLDELKGDPWRGYPSALSSAEQCVQEAEAMLWEEGGADACLVLLKRADDAVGHLEAMSSNLEATVAHIEREKFDCRRRLRPALDAMQRLTMRLDLDPGSGGAVVTVYEAAASAVEAARKAIEKHGTYRSRLDAGKGETLKKSDP